MITKYEICDSISMPILSLLLYFDNFGKEIILNVISLYLITISNDFIVNLGCGNHFFHECDENAINLLTKKK